MRKIHATLLLLVLCLLVSDLSAQLTRTVCASGCDYPSIQEAVNNAVAGDNIAILESVHTEANILINKNLNICPGGSGYILQASVNGTASNRRIFQVSSGVTVVVNDFILQNGRFNNGQGGAILNDGDLSLINCTIRNNSANLGGAITVASTTANLALINCTLSGNAASDQGGTDGSGGAIWSGGTCILTNCTVSGNSTSTNGSGDGGGITAANGSTLYLVYSTIAFNSISSGGLGAGVSARNGSTLVMENTIISNNSGASNLNVATAFPILPNTTNIVTSCTGTCPTFITDDPVLEPLSDNGGCTLTHDLGAASSAINAGTPIVLPLPIGTISDDQRGAARSAMEPDIGAVELSATVPACEPSLLCEGVLPVEFLHFSVSSEQDVVQLRWATAVEVNNEGFEIERSPNGSEWTTLGFVKGMGTTASISTYQYEDPAPLAGTSYYRLKQMDLDGQFEYSEIRSAAFVDAKNGFAVFPNPAGQTLHIQLPEHQKDLQLQLRNSLGQLVWEQQSSGATRHEIRFAEHDLPAGTYWLTYFPTDAGTGAGQTLRVLINP